MMAFIGDVNKYQENAIATLRAEVKQLRELAALAITRLDAYGNHMPWCESMVGAYDGPCDCGWLTVLAPLRQEQGRLQAYGNPPPHYDSPDNNAWTRANLGYGPLQPGDPGYEEKPKPPVHKGFRMIQAIASGELGGDSEDADEAELAGDIYWFVEALLGGKYADTPERTRRIDAWLEELGDAYTSPRASS